MQPPARRSTGSRKRPGCSWRNSSAWQREVVSPENLGGRRDRVCPPLPFHILRRIRVTIYRFTVTGATRRPAAVLGGWFGLSGLLMLTGCGGLSVKPMPLDKQVAKDSFKAFL